MSANRERVETLLKQALGSLEAEKPQDAVDATGEALALAPGDAEAVHVLGLAAVQMNELLRAEELFRIAHDTKPSVMEHAEALAIVSAKLGRLNDALFFGKLSVSLPGRAVLQDLMPKWLGTYEDAVLGMNRRDVVDEGRVLFAQGRFADALDKYRQGVEAGSMNVQGWRGARDSLIRLGKPYDALLAGQALSSIGKSDDHDMSVAGELLTWIGRFEEGQACHVSALEGLASDPFARSAMIRDLCVQPDPDIDEIKKSERLWEVSFPEAREDLVSPGDKVFRLGVLSGRLCSGQGTDMIWPVLANAPTGKVEVHVYSNNPADDTLARRIRGAVANWTEIRGIDDRTAARIIRNDALHALLDLDGYGVDGRPGILPAKPAPVLLNWFGDPDAQSKIYDGFIGPWGLSDRASSWTRMVSCLSPSPDTIVSAAPSVSDAGPFRIGLRAAPRKYTETVLKSLSSLCKDHERLRIIIDPNALGGVAGADDLEPRIAEHGFLDQLEYSPLSDDPVLALEGFAEAVDLVLELGPDQDATLAWEMISRSCPILATATGPARNKVVNTILMGLGLSGLVFDTLTELFEAAGTYASSADQYNSCTRHLKSSMEDAVRADKVSDVAGEFFALVQEYSTSVATDAAGA